MRRSIISLMIRHPPQIMQRSCDAFFVPELSPNDQALLGKRACRSVVIPTPCNPPEVVEHGSDTTRIPEPPPNGQALLKKGMRRSIVAEIISQMSRPRERLPSRRCVWRGPCQP